MVSPTKPSAVNTSEANYSQVPNPDVTSPELNNFSSPDPDAYNRLSAANLSPENGGTPLLGRDSMHFPAPSLISRDSTHESLLPPGTPSDNRSSWGSNAALAGAAADGSRRAGTGRGQSNLAHSSVGWNNTSNDRLSTSDEDEEQGHIAPAAAAGAAGGAGAAALSEKPAWAGGAKKSRKGLWIALAVVGGLVVVGLAVGLGVGLTRGDKDTTSEGANSGENAAPGVSTTAHNSPSAGPSATTSTEIPVATSGGRGSLITLEDGTEMTYDNELGGTWVYDPADPFKNTAQAQSYTPPLNQSWRWGVDIIYGVNLGGWLNTEPFIVPGLYETYATGPGGRTAVDEYTLSQNMGSNLTAAMTEHYDTFITERDIAEIASAGLNWIRLPIAHWAIETSDDEPYLERVSWTYVLKAIGWARKYGLRVNLDLHTLPGSQNGWNHSGKLGTINWMNGVMGLANAQRALEYIRTLTQFVSQPEYAPIVQMIGFNEPQAGAIGQPAVGAFYHEMYNMIRDITGVGEGNGPFISIMDGFIGIRNWFDFLPGADRLALDQHPYLIFGDQPTGSLASIARSPCSIWASQTNDTSIQYGMNVAGEWSAAPNDCGQWINTVGGGSRYDGTFAGYTGPVPGSCDYWNDWTQWNQTTKDDMLTLTMASMDALQNFFFWTWKIGNSTGPITEVNPFWHYRLGLREGWIPKDPRTVAGVCAGFGVSDNPFTGFSEPYMTGGAGAGTISAASASAYPWPPASFTNVGGGQMDQLPQFTQTGTPITMPAATFTSPGSTETINAGSGWANPSDSRRAYVPVASCSYPAEYSAANLAIPATACGAGLVQPTRRALQTPAP